MAESNKMKDMPVNKLMVQMGIPMILSMGIAGGLQYCRQCVCRKYESGQ